jgi:6-phosphogluconolactonase (cycloisomerase 2 family)
MKFGKAFMMSALSAGTILGITSCVQSYTVGYLYVTGTTTAATGDNGIISGFKIDHNKGNLTPINGLPISSGGSNPVRAFLLTGGRFIYVLNRGVNSAGNDDCTLSDPCTGANITEFAIGGNGILTSQGQDFFPQGKNSMRLIPDPNGNFLYVLDHDAPDNFASSYNPLTNACTLALGAGVETCGDITAFKIDPNTGRLTLVVDAQVTSASGSPLSYFPVPSNPIDFVFGGSGFVLTMSGTPSTGNYVFPYSYNQSNGQLTINQNSSQPVGAAQATAIVSAAGNIYVLDAEPLTYTPTMGSQTTVPSQILPFTVGTNGALQQQAGGIVPGDAVLTKPIYMIEEAEGKWMYVAYEGDNNTSTGNPTSGIAGWVIDPQTRELTPELTNSPWGSGSGPQCILEDPSKQFIYTANFNDSTVTGRALNVQTGTLDPLPGNANKAYPLSGPATWCLYTGRTS